MQKSFLFLSLLLVTGVAAAQPSRVEPPNWWIGMEDTTLQLLIYGEGLGQARVTLPDSPVHITATRAGDSDNYLFVDLAIPRNLSAGPLTLYFARPGQATVTYDYPLRVRERPATSYRGFTSADAIYLITPDRFASADPGNDKIDGLREASLDRAAAFARHGGDLRGITAHLDYIERMGFTAVWPSPVLENDMPAWSYHGYAITDYYRVDPRFGDLSDYRELADSARTRGLKLIMDQVVNHCGSGHWWMEDLPFADWLNFQDSLQVTNHRRTVHQDPYAAGVDRELMTGGWFVPTMPDLNQRNPYLANYLIQNSLWWIETLGLGGVRQDTYPYPDKDFMARWSCRIMREYPAFSIVGEEWSYNPALVAYWQRGHVNADGYASCLPSVMDFPLQAALIAALREPEGWDTGLIKLYEALANDFVYAQPQDLMIFAENHDMDRLATQVGGDVQLVKMALAVLTTMRGIPQFYYGSEVLLDNDSAPGDHGAIRADMPGGWPDDRVNAFTGENLTDDQRAVQQYLQQLLRWRRSQPALARGSTLHFAPREGVYVYGRLHEEARVMIVLNKTTVPAALDVQHYAELIGDATLGIAPDGTPYPFAEGVTIPPRSALLLELR